MSKASKAKKRKERANEVAAWRGLKSGRYMQALPEARVTDPTSKQKDKCPKLPDPARLAYDADTGRYTTGTLEAPRGTFVQFGARTKEGQLQLKQRGPNDKRKSHECDHKRTLGVLGIGMSEATNGTHAVPSDASAPGTVPAFVTRIRAGK